MVENFVDNIAVIGPVFAIVWLVTLLCITFRPQSYFNSLLLMASILVTMIFIAGFLGSEGAGYFLLACVALIMLALLLVPVLLIINGIQMIRKESVCFAHMLSLVLGIIVGIGEIATFIYVFGYERYGNIGSLMMFISATVFYFSFLILSFVVYSIFIQRMPHRKKFDYVIIHGCGLKDGERVSKLLQDRVDKAIEVYRKCGEKPMLIPSGGKGSDEKISEAQAMKDYLLEMGIPEERIVLEDQSTTTRENLTFSNNIIQSRPGRKRTALISSNYHVYRCLRLAKELKIQCTGIGAHTALYYWPSALIREFVAVFLTKKFLIWSIIGYLIFISPVPVRLLSGI